MKCISWMVGVMGVAALASCRGAAARDGGASSQGRVTSAARVAAPDATRLLAHVAWLADDAQEGRRAGTEAGERAGKWIAARLDELGLEPLGDAGTFSQSFDVPLPAKLGPASGVALLAPLANEAPLETRLAAQGEVEPLFCSSGGRAQGALAFRGYGVINAENNWHDYDGERGQVAGRVVLIVRGTPASKAPAAEPTDAHGAVQPGDGWGSSGSLFMKVMNAKRHGAVAVLVAPHPSQRDEALPEFDHSRAAQAGIPALAIRYDVALRLLPEYEALVAAIDADGADAGRADDTRAPQLAVNADVERGKGPAYNVLARLPGADSSRVVLVGAHYDHLGHGGEGSLSPGTHGEIHNGADDNASGTAAVIEIARLLAARGEPACDIVFALWSGEELGLLGSEYWAQHPTLELSRVVAKLNLDMVGRAGKGSLAVLGVGSAEPFESWLNEAGPRSGLDLKLNRSGQGVGGSDHQTFLKRKIPALHFFSGVHADYHKPSDDVERFEAEGTAKVVGLCVELIARIQNARQLAWIEPPAPEQGGMRIGAPMRVWFGTVPEYSYEGKGLLLAGTSAGSPAEKAGMLAGDVLVQVGDVKVDTIQDFMYALQIYKAGDVVLAKFLRDGVEESTRVTLATRDAQ
jgi:hypothetical protein